MSQIIPVILFAYARPDYLQRTLECLKADRVSLIYAFSDGPRTPDKAPAVEAVRRVLREIDWCEVVPCERESNLGLGGSILTGVSEVFQKHDAIIVFEDDLICVPGTYPYLCAALERYRDDERVMSVTGWTHPRAIPPNVGDQPYFDGRAECWTWGTWKRSWAGMEQNALQKISECQARGIDVYRYGVDLYEMAQVEAAKNIWAVRWSYHHILHGGLCLRPPRSMVDHIGVDTNATNVTSENGWSNPPLQPAPPIPKQWPNAVENPACSPLWQAACGTRPNLYRKIRRFVGRNIRPLLTRPR